MGLNDKVSPRTGEIQPIKGVRGSWGYSKRTYVNRRIDKPIRSRKRQAPVGADPLEQRMANVRGSNLERIVFKRLETIWGPPNIGFIYKYQIGAVEGVKDARAFIGGIEVDFVVLRRPSGRPLALEPSGAHWHGPKDQAADQERALQLIGLGYDFGEIFEWEVMMGDDYLDQRIMELIGAPLLDRIPLDRDLDGGIREVQPLETELRQT